MMATTSTTMEEIKDFLGYSNRVDSRYFVLYYIDQPRKLLVRIREDETTIGELTSIIAGHFGKQ